MFDKIENIAKSYKCFIEILIEDSISLRVRCRGLQIEDISKSRNCGGQVRVINKNKSAFVNFNSIDKLNNYIRYAIEMTELLTKETNDDYNLRKDFIWIDNHDINLEETSSMYKINKIFEYNKKINELKGVYSSVVTYGDSYKKVYYVNSWGSKLLQIKKDLIAGFTPVIRDNKGLTVYPFTIGSFGDFSVVDKFEDDILNKVTDIINANIVSDFKSGDYPVIFDSILAGAFIHEVIGHLIEADMVSRNSDLIIGNKLTSDIVTVEDRPDITGLRGSYKYDDEGIETKGTTIIKNGILKNYLHSCETANKFNTLPTGNARISSYKYKPSVRMSNFIVKCGRTNLKDMITEIEYGVYAKGWKGANTDLDKFTLYPREAYLIKDGEICGLIPNMYFKGDIRTFNKISKIGDSQYINQGISCSKFNQRYLPICTISPDILISSCYVGVI